MNEQNLIRPEDLTPSERRESASRAGKASGAARRKKRDMKQCMQLLLSLPATTEQDWEALAKAGMSLNVLPEDEITNTMVVNAALLNAAKSGDVAAVKELRSIIRDDERLKIERERLKLDREKAFPTVPEKGSAYVGIPASLIAPAFASVNFAISEADYSEYVFPGGRGSTKSSFISLQAIDLLEKNSEMHACILRQVGNTLKDSVYNQILWAISALGLDSEYSATKSPLEITKIKTGQKIYFRGADDSNKIKSIKPPFGYIGILWFEELDQFDGAEAVRKIEQSVIRGGDRAYKFKSFNPPKSAQNWANKYIKTPRTDRLITESTYLTVPRKWLGEAFLNDAEFLKSTNPTAYENEYMGVANGTGGNVFDNLVAREITDEDIKTFGTILHGVDWGWYPDPFAYVRCAYQAAQHTLIIYDEYRCNKRSNEETAAELTARGVTEDDIIMCDNAEKKSVADYRAYGLAARAVEKGPGTVPYSMKWLQSLTAIIIDPVRCPETYKEFSEYEYERNKDGEIISGYPDRDNHSIDAVRYATQPIWRKKGK